MKQEITPGTGTISLEHEVSWSDIAPLLDDLQTDPNLTNLTVDRWSFRPGAGGPGFDLVPILIYLTISALVAETVKDAVYPKLKKTVYGLYRRLPGVTPTGKVYPLGIRVVGIPVAIYRLPPDLNDVSFAEAIQSIPTHYAGLKERGNVHVVLTFDAEAQSWIENVEAGEFETWVSRRQSGNESAPSDQDRTVSADHG